jgi:hypothetical protein
MQDAERSPWRFAPGEDLRQAFRRVAAAEIERARSGLESLDMDRAEAIHRARRSFKKLRALLRLAKPSLGAAHATENRRWRDAGRLLASARNVTAQQAAFEKLLTRCHFDLSDEQAALLRQSLSPPDPSHAVTSKETERNVHKVIATLNRAERQLDHLNWPGKVDKLERGLRSAQRRLVRSFEAVCEDERPELLHEWRKRLKDHASQIGLLRNVLPSGVKATRQVAETVADLLGEERDLWLLAERLQKQRAPRLKSLRNQLLTQIEGDRRLLREAALGQGRRLSSKKPSRYADKLARAWERAAKEADAAASSAVPAAA